MGGQDNEAVVVWHNKRSQWVLHIQLLHMKYLVTLPRPDLSSAARHMSVQTSSVNLIITSRAYCGLKYCRPDGMDRDILFESNGTASSAEFRGLVDESVAILQVVRTTKSAPDLVDSSQMRHRFQFILYVA